MKALMGFMCVVLTVICVALTFYVSDMESHAKRWQRRVKSVQHIEKINGDLLEANMYSQKLMCTIKIMAEENAAMCKREAKMTQIVNQYKEENRRLKQSLTEAVNNLREQQQELNQLHEQLERLQYQVKVLEKALENKVKKVYNVMKTTKSVTDVLSVIF